MGHSSYIRPAGASDRLCDVTGFRAGAGQAAAQIFQVDAIDSASALERLVKEWTVLWNRSESGTRFQHPQRTLPRLRTLDRGAFICALAMRHDGRLVAFAPMFQHRHAANSSVRQISFIGASVSDCVDILAEPEFSAEAAACVLQYLTGNREHWDICDFQGLPENSALPQAATPHGLTAALLPSSHCNQRLLLWHGDSRLPSPDWPDKL